MFTTGLTNYASAIPSKYTTRVIENANVYWPKGDEIPPAAEDDDIANYFAKKVTPDSLP